MFVRRRCCLFLMITANLASSVVAEEPAVWKEVKSLIQEGSRKNPIFNPVTSKDLRTKRDASVKSLIIILRDSTLSKNARVQAAMMLGDLRAPEAVDALLQNLTLQPGGLQPVSPLAVGTGYHCYGALLKIGKPASRKALVHLRSENDRLRRMLLVGILAGVEGRKVGRFLLQGEIAAAKSAAERKNLRLGLKAFLAMTANEREFKTDPRRGRKRKR